MSEIVNISDLKDPDDDENVVDISVLEDPEPKKKQYLTVPPRFKGNIVPKFENWTPEKQAERGTLPNLAGQFGSGIGAFFTGLPALAGFIGVGGETLGRKITSDDDISWGQALKESMKGGKDMDLIDMSMRGQEKVEDFFNVGKPQGLAEQAAFYLPSAIPNPLSIGRWLTLGANLATPLVKIAPKVGSRAARAQAVGGNRALLEAARRNPLQTAKDFATKSNVGRLGLQTGLVAGIDQGIRAAIDAPTLANPVTEQEISDMTVHSPEVVNIADLKDPEVETVDVSRFEESKDNLFRGVDVPYDAEFVKANEESERNARNAELTGWALGAGALLMALGGYKYGNKLFKNKTVQDPQFGLEPTKDPSVVKQILDDPKSAGENAHNKIMSQLGEIETRLRADGVPENEIATLAGQEISDYIGRSFTFMRTGRVQEGLDSTVQDTHSLVDTYREFAHLPKTDRDAFLAGLQSKQEWMNRTRATAAEAIRLADDANVQIPRTSAAYKGGERVDLTYDELKSAMNAEREIIEGIRGKSMDDRVKPNLFKHNNRTGRIDSIDDQQLRTSINAYDSHTNNVLFKRMEKHLYEINETILDMNVARGVWSPKYARMIKNQFSRRDAQGNKHVMYLPGARLSDKASWLQRIGSHMGFGTSTGRSLSAVSHMLMRASRDQQGIDIPLDPFNATAMYTQAMFEHADKSLKQWNALARLTGLNPRFDRNGNLSPIASRPDHKDVSWIGHVDIEKADANGNYRISWRDDDKVANIRKELGMEEVTSPNDFMNRHKNVMWVQREGNWYGFYVRDAGLKTALEFDPTLSNQLLRGLNTTKKIFQSGTTGVLSPFSFTSWLYNVGHAGLTSGMRDPGLAITKPLQVTKDSVIGSVKIFLTKVADDVADLASESIARNGFVGQLGAVKSIRDRLKNVVLNSQLHALEREGSLGGVSINSDQFANNMSDIFAQSTPFIGKNMGLNGIRMLWRTWEHFNTAMHEGTAYGMYLRRLGQRQANMAPDETITGNELRTILADVRSYTGDVRRRGSLTAGDTRVMDIVHASIPYSGAMLQSWSTLGKAFKQAGPAKVLTATTSIIGIPTAMEVTYNNSLDDGKTAFTDANGRLWTYADYYWNGFTAQQRANNYIIFKPGKPPWEAVVVPVTPEIGLFRSIVIDGMDAMFGISAVGLQKGGGNHFLASLARVFDIPLPPLVAASLSAGGIDARVGVHMSDDPNSLIPVDFLKFRSLGKGETRSYNWGRMKHTNDSVDMTTKAWLGDLFGASMMTHLRLFEGFEGSKKQGGDLSENIVSGLDSWMASAKIQARPVTSLFGQALRPSASNEISNTLYQIDKNVKGLENVRHNLMTQGYIRPDGKPTMRQMPMSSDPVTTHWAMNLHVIKDSMAPIKENITDLKNRINELGNSFKLRGERVSVKQRDDLVNAYNLELASERAKLLKLWNDWDDRISHTLGQKLGDPSYATSIRDLKDRPSEGGKVAPYDQ